MALPGLTFNKARPNTVVPINRANPITNRIAIAQFGGIDFVNNSAMVLNGFGLAGTQYGLGLSTTVNSIPGARQPNAMFKTSNGAYNGDFTLMQFCAPIAGTTPEVGIAFGDINGSFSFSGFAYNSLFNLGAPAGEFIGQVVFYTYNGGFNGGNFELRNACDGKPHAFHVRRIGTQMDGGRDGLPGVVPSTSTRNVAAANNPNVYIGGGHNPGIAFKDSPIPITLVFNRGLSNQEIFSLANNPFQVLSPSYQAIWSILAGGVPSSVLASILAQYNLRGVQSSSAASSYKIRTTSETTRALDYLIRTNAASSTVVNYLVKNTVPSDIAITYLIKGSLPVSAVANYLVRSNATSSVISDYLIRSLALSTSSVAYTLRGAVTSDETLSYNILEALGVVTSSRLIQYNILAALVAAYPVNYTLRSAETSSSTQNYTVRGSAQSSTTVLYNVLSAGQVISNILIEYKVRANISASQESSWFIRSIVTSDSGLVYTIRATTANGLEVDYKIYTNASSNSSLSYNLRNALAKESTSEFTVRGNTSKSLVFNYNVLAPVSLQKNLNLLYSILQDLGGDFTDIYITVNPVVDVVVSNESIQNIYIV